MQNHGYGGTSLDRYLTSYCPRQSVLFSSEFLLLARLPINSCTQFDEILHKHVSWQQHEIYWISKIWVKGQGLRTEFSNFSQLRDEAKKACGHNNWWTAALSLVIFCTNMYHKNRTNLLHLKVKVIFVRGPKFTKFFSSNVGKSRSWYRRLLTVNCLIRSRDIRDQSLFRVVRNLVHCW